MQVENLNQLFETRFTNTPKNQYEFEYASDFLVYLSHLLLPLSVSSSVIHITFSQKLNQFKLFVYSASYTLVLFTIKCCFGCCLSIKCFVSTVSIPTTDKPYLDCVALQHTNTHNFQETHYENISAGFLLI